MVGDVLKLGCDQEVPCDAIVLSSDHSGGQVSDYSSVTRHKMDMNVTL